MAPSLPEDERVRFIHGFLQREVDELVRQLQDRRRTLAETSFPEMDVVEKRDAIHIYLDLPGVAAEDFTLYAYEDLLVIEGYKRPARLAGKVNFLRMERTFAHFRRMFRVPVPFSAEDVEARLKDGALHVRVAKH